MNELLISLGAAKRRKEWERRGRLRAKQTDSRVTLDKSKKVGRFRRRDRGVSHVFAIFFCGPNFSMPFLSSRIPRKIFVSSLFIRRFLFYLPPITFSFSRIIKRRTKGERTSEKKGKDLRLLRHTEEDETRHLRFIVDD